MPKIFEILGLPERPNMLAPLAGVSDHPFRRICARYGADLTFVEMLSATAIIYGNLRTLDMMERHPSETILGVQLTGRSADEVGQAVAILNDYPFDTVDLNMGCPVRKVVNGGSGSAILKDPQRVYDTVRAAVANTDRPVSAKIRIGWDHHSINAVETAQAAEAGGAVWVTVHGRTRNDDYAVPVNLEQIALVKQGLRIPVVGNGNIFAQSDAWYMQEKTGVDGIMVSRGALGNPWIFRELATGQTTVTLDEWLNAVLDHMAWHAEMHGSTGMGALRMRKHMLWYVKGWPGARKVRAVINDVNDLDVAKSLITAFAEDLAKDGARARSAGHEDDTEVRFEWDPKYEMDRRHDRGVGNEEIPVMHGR